MTLEPLRAWSRRSPLFRSVWGFGVLLLPVVLLAAVIDYAAAVRQGPVPSLKIMLGVWTFACNGLGMFIAAALAHSLTRSRAGSEVSRTVLLAGLTFVFVFPLAAVAMTASWILWFERSIRGAQDVMEYFSSYWWGDFRAFGLSYLVGIACVSALYLWLPRPTDDSARRAPVAANRKARQRRDILLGGMLFAFGVMLAHSLWAGLTGEIHRLSATATANPQWQAQLQTSVAYLQRELWSMVIWRSLPFLLVGGLLLVLAFARTEAPRPR